MSKVCKIIGELFWMVAENAVKIGLAIILLLLSHLVKARKKSVQCAMIFICIMCRKWMQKKNGEARNVDEKCARQGSEIRTTCEMIYLAILHVVSVYMTPTLLLLLFIMLSSHFHFLVEFLFLFPFFIPRLSFWPFFVRFLSFVASIVVRALSRRTNEQKKSDKSKKKQQQING